MNVDPQEQVLLIADRLIVLDDEVKIGEFLTPGELSAMARHLRKCITEMRKNNRNAIISQKVSIQ